jgi:NADPH-dependent F420 reductase
LVETLAFIGGTGPEGKGLAARFARAGLSVIIGSRSAERGEEAAKEIRAAAGGSVSGATNADAVLVADTILITLPYSGLNDTLPPLAGAIGDKIVISTVVPLEFSGGRASIMQIDDGSAAEETKRLLPDARVVGAFQNLAAHKLFDVSHALEGDVIVTSDDREALREVMALSERIEGIRGVNGGNLRASRYVEGITAMLVGINRNYKAEAHVKIVGI